MKLELNCEAEYFEGFLAMPLANELFKELASLVKSTNYRPETDSGETCNVRIGKIMFMDQDLLDQGRFPEQQWGPTKPWTDQLLAVKTRIEEQLNEQFQVCVVIYYPDGNSGVGFHSDFAAFGDTSIIPSISLGEERAFVFREKESGDELVTMLANGSLITMGKHCQERYEHSLPINPSHKNPRINLTFRKYGFND